MLSLLISSLFTVARADCPDDCPPACPDQLAVQSAWVQQNFSLDKFWGPFYELQFHDNTQPGFMSCQRSVKSPNNGGSTYKDLFSLHIAGDNTAICDLEFNITSQPGVFLGHWSGTKRPDLHDINNTVVDVGLAANGTYTWVLEFQCADNVTAAAAAGTASGIHFAAINFYHRLPLVDDDVMPAMEARARAQGIGFILDSSPGLTKVNQKTCVDHDTYPALNASVKMCGQAGGGR